MSYSLDPLNDSCYENTNVLINKFNIRNNEKLSIFEKNITSVSIAKALIEIPFKDVDFNFYKYLHHYVFSDIYEWAGNIRTVNMSKKGTNFCPVEEINAKAERIFNRLNNNKYLSIYSGNEFIDEFTELYCDLNILHPFREGNGRIQRLFLTMLLKSLGKTLDFSHIDKDILMLATIKSISGDIFLLHDIFSENIK